jgi:hypothetical protein
MQQENDVWRSGAALSIAARTLDVAAGDASRRAGRGASRREVGKPVGGTKRAGILA